MLKEFSLSSSFILFSVKKNSPGGLSIGGRHINPKTSNLCSIQLSNKLFTKSILIPDF